MSRLTDGVDADRAATRAATDDAGADDAETDDADEERR